MLFTTRLEALILKNIQGAKDQNIGSNIKSRFYRKNQSIKKTTAIISIKIRTPNR